MAVIHVLDKHTAELIAAGEVVERPASVVKELLENAIDAGASQITVTIESGGVKLIEISDNGSGIEAEYIPTAFIRHATSKIRTEDDLNHIHTLGFRGEALASIASVARVEVLTRTENDECASVYRIEGGEDYPLEPGARGVGTTIRVQDLFYNTPARMKFLKKDSSEGTFVADIVAHVALSHPEVSFKFVREGKLQYVTPGDGKLRSAAYAVLGREFSRDLMELDNQEGVYRVWGLITQPRSCRASRSMQYFYINGRYVRNRTMMAAMETAFKGTTMQGKFPGGILLLEMPADLVDVNVHPAKTEVRFARENDIFDLVYHAVKLALAQPGTGERRFAFEEDKKDEESNKSGINDNAIENDVKKNNFTGLSAIIPGQAEPGTLHEHTPQPQRSFRSFTPTPAAAPPSRPAPASHPDILPAPNTAEEKPTEHSWTTVASGLPIRQDATLHSPAPAPTESEPEAPAFAAALGEGALDIEPDSADLPEHQDHMAAWDPAPKEEMPAAPAPQQTSAAEDTPEQLGFDVQEGPAPLRYVGEIFKTYILAERGEEICIIDKHAAHERQLFEKLAANYGDVPAQLLLEPLVVELSAEEKTALLSNLELLESAGLEIDDFGGNSVFLRSVPEFIYLLLAAERIGASLLCRDNTLEENIEAVQRANAKVIFVHDFFSKAEIEAYREQTNVNTYVIVPALESGDRAAMPVYLQHSLDALYPDVPARGSDTMMWADFCNMGQRFRGFVPAPVNIDRPLLRAYTSGSTGPSKQVIHSAHSIIGVLAQMNFYGSSDKFRPTWLLTILPPALIAVVVSMMLLPLAGGMLLLMKYGFLAFLPGSPSLWMCTMLTWK